AYAHQALPFEELVQTLERERGVDRVSLCQVMFILQNAIRQPPPLSSLTLRVLEAAENRWETNLTATTFEIIMGLRDNPQGLNCVCIYKPQLFDNARVSRLMRDFRYVLERIVVQPQQLLSTFDTLNRPIAR